MTKLLFLIFIWFALASHSHAQISEGGTPHSFSEYFLQVVAPQSKLQTIILPAVDLKKIEEEAKIGQGSNLSFKGIAVDMDLKNVGEWLDLPDGDRLWRLKIKSVGATSIAVVYDNFVLPEGGKFFVYDEAKKTILGAFSEKNNHSSRQFSTGIISGDCIVLEYYEPAAQKDKGVIHISHFSHGYKLNPEIKGLKKKGGVKDDDFDFGDSGSCNININCGAGTDWQDEKRGVARVLMFFQNGSAAWCTGSLINNTANDGKPYFLSAYHCQDDGANLPNFNAWVFYFNYESPDCGNPATQPIIQSLTGCTEKVKGSSSDYLLVELNNTIPTNYNPYFAGWDKSGTVPTSAVSIHHPAGDIKKIAKSNGPFTNSSFDGVSAWGLSWNEGVTEGGSSGSPLFDQNGRVIGQLYGGLSFCAAPNDPDYYGRFSVSWPGLQPFLAPNNTSITTLNGYDFNTAIANDVGVTVVATTLSNCDFTANSPFQITVKNFGAVNQTNITIEYRLKNIIGETIQSGTMILSLLNAGASNTVTVNLNLANNGNYIVEASTSLASDQNTGNNLKTATFSNINASQNASNISFDNNTFFEMGVFWTNGNGQQRIILVKEGTPFTAADLPVNGTNYIGNAVFGSAIPIGAAYPVYVGSNAISIRVTNLKANTIYYLAIVEFSCSPTKYLLTGLTPVSNLVTNLESEIAKAIKVYPNPSNSEVTLDFEGISVSKAKLVLLNNLGILIHEQILVFSNQEKKYVYDLRHLAKGFYIMRIEVDKAFIQKKLVVK